MKIIFLNRLFLTLVYVQRLFDGGLAGRPFVHPLFHRAGKEAGRYHSWEVEKDGTCYQQQGKSQERFAISTNSALMQGLRSSIVCYVNIIFGSYRQVSP